MMKKILAIIPARGGSKRLPRKNLLPLAGKPLIAWSIEAAQSAKQITNACVTSDDKEILRVAREYGVSVIERPNELASDIATTFDAVKHAIESQTEQFDYAVLLQPTSPLRTAQHIDEAITLLEEKSADAVVSVCETAHSPLWSNILPDDLSMVRFLPDRLNKRSQDLPTYYRLNGAIYICQVDRLLKEESFFLSDKIYAYIMSTENSVDIDNQLDFYMAEILLRDS